jgi:alpha-1,3-rhamnosyl/mannosyltransferase
VGFENTALRLVTGRADLDCVHHFFGTLPLFAQAPSVVTVYDLMVFERPDDYPPLRRWYLKRMERHMATHATVIAPISRSTGEHLHRRLGVPWDRMVVVPTPLSTIFAPGDAEHVARFRSERGLPDQFWLCVSGTYPNKNYDRLLDALRVVRDANPNGWPLVVRADPEHTMRRMVERAGVERHVIMLPRLTEREMALLYSAASALVFPSLFEGGGIPVMEAMVCGCPVVASEIPTTREFAGAAALRFDPTRVASIVEAMTECESNPALRRQLATAGLAQAHRFSPQLVATACMSAYARAVATAPGGP